MDGSFHAWFEERGPRGCLMNMVGDGAVEVRYRGKRMEYEDLVVRPQVEPAASREPRRESAKQVGSKSAKDHPWWQGYEQRMKLQRLKGSQVSALVGVSASASP